MARKILGISFDSTAIHLALVSDGKILKTCSASLSEAWIQDGIVTDPDAMVHQLKSILKEHRFPNCPCALALSRDQVSFRSLILPAMSDAQIRLNLPYEFPELADSAVYRYSLISRSETDMQIHAAAVSVSYLTACADLLGRAGLPLCCAVTEETAWAQLLYREKLTASIGILDRRDSASSILFYVNGRFDASKDLDLSRNSLSEALRKAVNAYNLSLPMDVSPVEEVYCPDPLPENLSGIQIRSTSRFAQPPEYILAAGAALSRFSTEDTLNFFQARNAIRPWAVLVPAVALCVGLLTFVNAGILKPLEAWTLASTNLASKQEQLSAAAARVSQFDELEQAYLRWGLDQLNPEERSLVSRTDVLSLIQEHIAPYACVTDLTLNGNELTMHLRDVTLEAASILMDTLESGPLVSRAAVVSAAAEDGKQANILICITLTQGGGLNP